MIQEYQDVYDGPTEKVIALMKAAFSSQFKTFYDGDPILIGESSYPAMCFLLDEQVIEVENTGQDSDVQSLTIKLVLNKKDDYGASDTVDLTQKKLRYMVGARDPATGRWYDSTVLGVLRKNFTLGGTVTDQKIKVTYRPVIRPSGMKDVDMVTQEAHIVIENIETLVAIQRI
jgi:hypothetical protein